MSARLALGLGLGLCACATTPPPVDKPLVVRLAFSGSKGSCNWSEHYKLDMVPDLAFLGATFWPHMMPDPARPRRQSAIPLTTYGSDVQVAGSELNRTLCFRLYKRPSVRATGIPPVAEIEVKPDGLVSHLTATTRDPQISHLILGLTLEGQSTILSLDMREGPQKAQIATLPPGSRGSLIVVASHAGGEAQARRVLNAFQSSQARRDTRRMVFEGHNPVLRPYP